MSRLASPNDLVSTLLNQAVARADSMSVNEQQPGSWSLRGHGVRRHVDVLAVVLNAGYFIMLATWFLRRPENLGHPVSYFLLLVPALCVYAVRLRPFKSLAVAGGLVTGFVNFALLLAAVIGTGFSGRRYVEFVLVVVFVFGNTALVLAAWLLALARRT